MAEVEKKISDYKPGEILPSGGVVEKDGSIRFGGYNVKNEHNSKKKTSFVEIKNKFANWLLVRLLKYFNKDYILQFETSPRLNKDCEDFLKKKQFVQKHNGWWVKGFVHVRPMDDVFEVKTVSEYSENKTMYLSTNKWSFENYLNYLNRLM